MRAMLESQSKEWTKDEELLRFSQVLLKSKQMRTQRDLSDVIRLLMRFKLFVRLG